MNETRFQSAVSNDRPRGIRVIEVYSPKLGRRLQCFGEDVFRQWVRLEADPTVQAFCERPAYLDHEGKHLVDFWVLEDGREALLIVDLEDQPSPMRIGCAELPVRSVPLAELAAGRIWIANWERMLPVMTSCRSQMTPSLLRSILKFVSEPMQLSRIEQEFVTSDPTSVRAAIFNLLHAGSLQARQLQTEQLSFLTCFEPVRSCHESSPS